MSDVKKGRKVKVDPVTVARWRQARKASIAATAKRFGISAKTVSNYCRDFGAEAERQRAEWRTKREIEEADLLDEGARNFATLLSWAREASETFEQDPSWENFFRCISAANRVIPKQYRNKKPGEW